MQLLIGKIKSWSIGMDADVQTMANLLKFYNPSLILSVEALHGSHIGEVSQKEHLKRY
jgi:hypothetical protein